jgi:DNA end-binding protein Ku
MEALRRSVEQAKHDRGNVAPARRPARKRPAKQAIKPVAAPQPTQARKAAATKRSPARKTAAKKSTEGR